MYSARSGYGADNTPGLERSPNMNPLLNQPGVRRKIRFSSRMLVMVERDIEHAFQEERKHAVLLLFQEDARQQRHQEHEPYHPYRSAVERLFLSYHLTHVDADEEDRHAAPENLQVSYSLMYRGNILYQDAPHDHHHRAASGR